MTMPQPAKTITELFGSGLKNWGRWGADDQIGAINFLTPEQVVRGAKCVRSGKTFPLGLEILRPGGDPSIDIRGPIKKFMSADKSDFIAGTIEPMGGGTEYADDFMMLYLQASTQVDALGHVWYDDKLYNGYDAQTTIGGLKNCDIKPIADHGIVGRGVLLDIPRYRGVDVLSANEQVTLADLLGAAEKQGVEIQKHDILLIRTGWITVFYKDGMAAMMGGGEPGITDEPELIAWYHEMEFPTHGSDTIGGECSFSPISGTVLPLHSALMVNLGSPFQELMWLEDLADDCAADGQYDFMYVCSPLRIHTGTGSPVNPLAIK